MILTIPIILYIADLITNPPWYILRTSLATDCGGFSPNVCNIDILNVLHFLTPHIALTIAFGIILYEVFQ
jgi:hypothetical protein